ncbi:MAG: hypothetical protein QOG15_2771 [Solirubrobacteraceae bacterium]|jgi:hypothetical protein|nr:hypothetical protein [Solirubrobacteraceae bacterium]
MTVLKRTKNTCRWLDPEKGLKLRSCSKPALIVVKLASNGASWSYNVRTSIKLPKGSYRATVYGLDKAGNLGNTAAKAKRIVTFRIR